eukprot:COSAG01_NODE_5360_length_4308_cov_31.574210_4_plen_116_part_00
MIDYRRLTIELLTRTPEVTARDVFICSLAFAGPVLTEKQPSQVVFLTLLGGGVFKNDVGWIVDAIARALELVRHCCLEVHIVCYESRAHPLVTKLLEKVESGAFPLAPVRLTSPS